MSATWVVVLAVGAATIAIKAAGPVLAGERTDRSGLGGRVVELLPPSLLSALVVSEALADQGRLVVDARLVGLACAVVALVLRAPVLVVVVVAAASTAVARALGA
jgi:branched-subunit amino acid transport protein